MNIKKANIERLVNRYEKIVEDAAQVEADGRAPFAEGMRRAAEDLAKELNRRGWHRVEIFGKN